MDLAIVSVAALLTVVDGTARDVRVAAGAVAPTPLRLCPAEELLEGAPVSDEVLGRAGALARRSVAPITDLRSSEEYRRDLVGVLVKRAIAAVAT